MKLLLGVNTLQSLGQSVYMNHTQMWAQIIAHFGKGKVLQFTPPRMSIDRMRNTAAKICMENNVEYLCFVDDDVIVPIDGIAQLIAAMDQSGYDILAGHTIIRGYPFNSMVFKDDGKGGLTYFNDCNAREDGKWEYADESGAIVPCGAVGFSMVAMRVSTLKKLEMPLYVTTENGTEDVYFCMKLKRAFPDAKIGVVPAIETVHCGQPEMYSPENRDIWRVKYELEDPDLMKTENLDWRGKEYLERCLAVLHS